MIAIVKTPLQIICAVEYMHFIDQPLDSVKFLYLKKYDFSDEQMERTFQFFNIKNVEIVKSTNANILTLFNKKILLEKVFILKIFAVLKRRLLLNYLITTILKKIGPSEKIILGDPNLKLFEKCLSKIKGVEIVLLDDGLSSQRIKSDYSLHINYITSFSFIRNEAVLDQKVINLSNNFNYLKLRLQKLSLESDTIFFIGQPLIEAKLLKRHQLNELLEKIGQDHSNKKIIYIPHRWELSIDKYTFKENYEILLTPSLPIELLIFELKLLPVMIISFYSSALITLKKILPNDIYFQAYGINKGIRSNDLEMAYCFLNSINIPITEL